MAVKQTTITTKHCHMGIDSRIHWDLYVYFTNEAKAALDYWLTKLKGLNGHNCIMNTSEVHSGAHQMLILGSTYRY